MFLEKFRKGDRYLALLMSVVFATATSTSIKAQPQIPPLSQSPTTENPVTSGTKQPVQAFGGQLAVFLGHEDYVTSAVFSPDGSQILTASWDDTARLWDRQGNLLAILRGHEGTVDIVKFSPDGRYILTASWDRTARLWDTSGNLLTVFQHEGEKFTSAEFSPNGRYILTSTSDEPTTGKGGSARLWDTSGNLIAELQRDRESFKSAVFSPDGNRILTASRSIRLWDTSGNLLAELPGYKYSGVRSAVFSPDGRQILAFADFDAPVGLWDTSGNLLTEFRGHKNRVTSAVFSPDGRHILTGSQDHTARLWDTSGNVITELKGRAIFSPDGRHILTASNDRTARLWDSSGNLLTVFQLEGRVGSAVFSPDGRQILTVSDDRVIRLWDLSARIAAQDQEKETTQAFLKSVSEANAQLVEIQGEFTSAVLSPDGRQILTASSDNTARLWDTSGTLIAKLQGHEDKIKINIAIFSPDGRQILTASDDKTVRLWATSGKLLTVFQHKYNVNSAVFSPDGSQILTFDNSSAYLWDTAGKLLAVLRELNRVDGNVFSPDSRQILSAGWGNTARLWDTSGNLLVKLQGHESPVSSTVFSPDGHQILTATREGTVRLWDTSGKLLTVFSAHAATINSAVFSPNGRQILTASENGTARLWDTSGNILAVFRGHGSEVSKAVFSPDGRYILTASSDAYLWDTSGNLLQVFPGFHGRVRRAIFSPNGRHIFTETSNGIALWDLSVVIAAQSQKTDTLQAFKQNVSENNAQPVELDGPWRGGFDRAEFSPNGRQILTVGHLTAHLWDTSGKLLAVLTEDQPHRNDSVVSAIFSPNGRQILTASTDDTARLWDTSGKLLTVFRDHENYPRHGEMTFVGFRHVRIAKFSHDGRYILTVTDENTVRLWDAAGSLLKVFREHENAGWVRIADFSPDGHYILTVTNENTARLWDAAGSLLKVFQGQEGKITSAIFSPDSRYIVTTASNENTARLWDTSGKLLTVFQGHEGRVKRPIFSPDGRYILTVSDDNTARLWDSSGKLLTVLQGHEGKVANAIFSPDGRHILTTASKNNTARLWDTSGKLLTVLQHGEKSNEGVSRAEFSPDGRYIFTVGYDNTASLWDTLGNLLIIFRFREHTSNITIFSPDSRHILVTGSRENILTLQDVSAAIYTYAPEKLLQAATQLNQQGTVESRQQALQKLDEALKLYRAANKTAKAAHTLILIGDIHANLGQFQTAIDSYNQALPLSQQAGIKAEEAAILNSLGELYNNLADPKTALDYHNQALPLLYQLNDQGSAAKTFNNIGDIQAAKGEWKNALDSYNKALIISRPGGALNAEATALIGIGSTYIASKDWATALNAYNQSLIISRHLKDKIKETTILNQMGKIHAALGENSTALENYKQALTLSQQLGYKTEEAHILYNQAILNRQQNNLTAAKTEIQTAINIIESLRTQIASQELRQSYFARNQDYYQFYIDLLMQLHQQNPSQGYDALALNASERSRARGLLELLTEAGTDIRQGVDPKLVERERSLQQQLDNIEKRRIQILSGNPTKEQAEAIEREQITLLEAYRQVQTDIRATSPNYAALTQPKPLTLTEIQQQVLDNDTLLLQYSLGEDRSYLWAVTKTSISSYELPKRADIEALAQSFYQNTGKQNAPEQRGLGAVPREDSLEVTTKLSQILLSPVAGQLANKRLLIVSDGALQYLPFAALPEPNTIGKSQDNSTNPPRQAATLYTHLLNSPHDAAFSPPSPPILGGIRVQRPPKLGDLGGLKDLHIQGKDKTPTPLIVNHEIVNSPSASTIAILRQDTNGRKLAPKKVAVIADPVFSKDDERLKPSVGATTAGALVRRLPLQRGNPNDLDSLALTRSAREAGVTFQRLPFTRKEGDRILSLIPNTQSQSAFDFAANRTTATSPQLSQYQIVHFATHGILNSQNPELSGVVLSLVDEKGTPQNGFLRLGDIFNLNLPAELIVLSACETGLGKEIKGEGLVGLTRGFMYAGSPRVLVSLWSVADEGTSELMSRFYKKMMQENLEPAAALRAAQLEMLQSPQWKSPYYWAAFTLQGEWKSGTSNTPSRRGL